MPYAGVDYYAIDQLLTEDERIVRDTFRRFVTDEVMPDIAQHFRAGTFPRHLVRRMGELGALGATIEGHGCAGLGPVAYGLIMQELERADSGVRSFASVQGALAMFAIDTYGSEEQKAHWLPMMARGEAIGCFALSEPDFGSNPAGMRTRARQDGAGGDFILDGEKRWITSGSIADVVVVWARAENGVRGFLVERGTAGFDAHDIDGKFSLRASVTSELVFRDCRVPASAQLPLAQGIAAPLSCLNNARFGVAWGVLGAAMACYDEALSYTKDRAQFKRPLAGHQLVQQKLVDMLDAITQAQLLSWRLGRLKEEGKARVPQVSLAKRNNVAMALHVARTARDLLGANGITDAYQCGRHMCNLESVFTYEGTDHVHTLIVGQDITGLNAFD